MTGGLFRQENLPTVNISGLFFFFPPKYSDIFQVTDWNMGLFLPFMQNKSRAIFSLEILRKSGRFWIFPVMLPLKSYLLGQDWYNAQWGTDTQWHFLNRAVTFKGYSHCLKLTPEVMGGTVAQIQHFSGSYAEGFSLSALSSV